ncbi:MAG: SAM-dependent chlorinase/fluorinase [Deltaproteobacteria bacterium]|nr:SAM-dependent chlorinase/fluorinase [Deltaproteobacteria bacterium]MBW2308839.1 SAM-dependent chlorinase/fluorinase [Deltaproteobacteria bacterium]
MQADHERKADRPIVTLTTDFGMADGYVAAMKGVILSINPNCTIIDISHEISHHDILEARYVLERTYSFFPAKSIHVAVVDPGVGGPRKPILIVTDRYFFVGPDNGIFCFVPCHDTIQKVVALTNKDYFLQSVSDTFHGRDIFASCTAYLTLGIPPERLGPEIEQIVMLEENEPGVRENQITGKIIYIDRFGNLITNIRRKHLEAITQKGSYEILAGKKRLRRVENSYSAVPKGEVLAIFGSSGALEIAANQDNAAQKLDMKRGSPLIVISTG